MNKKILSAGIGFISVFLLLPETVPAEGSSTAGSPGKIGEIEVTAQYESGGEYEPADYVDIEWGEMLFICRETLNARWDPAAHEYLLISEAEWLPEQQEIRLISHSDCAVSVTLSAEIFDSDPGVRGIFDRDEFHLPSAVGTVPEEAPEETAVLLLSGEPGVRQTEVRQIGSATAVIRTDAGDGQAEENERTEIKAILCQYESAADGIQTGTIGEGIQQKFDDGTRISVSGGMESDNDISAAVFHISDEEVIQWLEKCLGVGRDSMYPFWIGFYNGAEETVPEGTVTVLMDLPEGYENSVLYFVDENGSIQNIPYRRDGSMIQFEAEYTGCYVFVRNAEETGTDVQNVRTGDGTADIPAVLGGLAGMAAVCAALRKKFRY